MKTKCRSADLPIPRGVRGVEIVQEAFRINTGAFLLHGHLLDYLLHTLNVFSLFRRTRPIHTQEHETSALEPSQLMLLLPLRTTSMQGLSSLDTHRAKAGFRAGPLAATLAHPKHLIRKMGPSAALKCELAPENLL